MGGGLPYRYSTIWKVTPAVGIAVAPSQPPSIIFSLIIATCIQSSCDSAYQLMAFLQQPTIHHVCTMGGAFCNYLLDVATVPTGGM